MTMTCCTVRVVCVKSEGEQVKVLSWAVNFLLETHGALSMCIPYLAGSTIAYAQLKFTCYELVDVRTLLRRARPATKRCPSSASALCVCAYVRIQRIWICGEL